jgi:hypothetical protein
VTTSQRPHWFTHLVIARVSFGISFLAGVFCIEAATASRVERFCSVLLHASKAELLELGGSSCPVKVCQPCMSQALHQINNAGTIFLAIAKYQGEKLGLRVKIRVWVNWEGGLE